MNRFPALFVMGVLMTVGWAAAAAPSLGASPAREALEGFLARHGASADLRALDALQGPANGKLASLVQAFEAYEAATLKAFAGADLDLARAWASGQAPLPASAEQAWALAHFDPAPILAARAAMEQAALDLRATLPSAGGLQLQVPGVLGLDTLGGPSTYAADMRLVIDFGGDDLWLNNAGGSNLLGACIGDIFGPGAAAAFDFAGQDRFMSGRGCGINGGAAIGAGFLFEGAGDDTYFTDPDDGNKGTNGGGSTLGVGFLRDLSGNDRYTAGGWGTNGGGWIGGLGALRDEAGDDIYESSFDGVNGGGSIGIGLLQDLGGHDLYGEGCHSTCTEAWDQTIVPKDLAGAQLDQ